MDKRKFIVVTFFILIFILFLHPLDEDGDFFHHMNIGHFLLTHHYLPQVDQFTFTAYSRPLVGYGWGAGVIYFFIFGVFKYIGISFLVSILAVVTFILLYLLLLNYSIPKKYALLLVLFSIAPISIRWPNRPEIFTYPLIIMMLLIDEIKKIHPKLVYLYPLIILAWANLYGSSVILGLILLIIFTARDLKLIIPTFLSILASFINGYGLKTIFYILNIPPIASYDLEWQGIFNILYSVPVDQLLDVQYRILIYFIYLAIFLFTLALSYKKIFKKTFFLFLSLAVFVPFFTFRQVPLATIFSIPILAYCISLQTRLKQILTFLIITLSLFSIGISFYLQKPDISSANESYPTKAIDFINKNNLEGRVFNNQRLGAFLSYYLYPLVKIYVDSGDELYLGTDVINDFYKTISVGKSIIPILRKYQADLALVDLSEGPSYQSLFYSDEYVPVFLDNRYLIAVKKKPAEDKKLAVLTAIDPFSETSAKNGKEKEALSFYKSLDGDSFNNVVRMANSFLANNEPDKTIELVSKLKEGTGPKAILFKIDKDTLFARAYLTKFDCQKSKYYIDLVKKEIRNKFIFSPDKIIPSSIDELEAAYNLRCSR